MSGVLLLWSLPRRVQRAPQPVSMREQYSRLFGTLVATSTRPESTPSGHSADLERALSVRTLGRRVHLCLTLIAQSQPRVGERLATFCMNYASGLE